MKMKTFGNQRRFKMCYVLLLRTINQIHYCDKAVGNTSHLALKQSHEMTMATIFPEPNHLQPKNLNKDPGTCPGNAYFVLPQVRHRMWCGAAVVQRNADLSSSCSGFPKQTAFLLALLMCSQSTVVILHWGECSPNCSPNKSKLKWSICVGSWTNSSR